MPTKMGQREATTRRRVFPGWSIEVPEAFSETFLIEGGGYWHAWDSKRSVSMSSILLTEDGRPVPADLIIRETRTLADAGDPVVEMPAAHPGWATKLPAEPGARASRLLSGGLAVDGVVLLVTITADDSDWALRTWLSIRSHPRGH
jgi:hypothetical protein